MDQAQKIVLEITERGFPDRQGALAIATGNQYGTRLALDDVTSGGRNLVVLVRHGFDTLKIDRSLVAQIGEPGNEAAPLWLDHLRFLGQGAMLDIVAEGVETREQIDTLVAAGVTRVQGPGPGSQDFPLVFRRRRDFFGGSQNEPPGVLDLNQAATSDGSPPTELTDGLAAPPTASPRTSGAHFFQRALLRGRARP